MKKNKFIDPAIQRKATIIDKSLKVLELGPLPAVVEISESGTCNRKCSFCPRSAPGFEDKNEFIEIELFKKLMEELGEVGFEGIVLFSGFVEPLLDKNIYSLIALAAEKLPSVRLELVTNGDVLNESRLRLLFDSGLSTLLISVYDSEADAIRFEDMCKDVGLNESQYVVRKRYLPEDQDFGITINNRSGMLDGTEYIIPSLSEPLSEPCHYPHYTFFMDYQGDVLMCPHDWGKKRILGNIKNNKFSEIWYSPRYQLVRERLGNGDRRFSPCDVCDVTGTLMGGKHVDEWSKA